VPTLTVASQLTLVEVAKRDIGGDIAVIADNLSKINKMLLDAPWVPCNNLTTHLHTQTLLEPTGDFRLFNGGVGSAAGTTKQVEEPTAMMEKYSKVDEAIIDIYPEGMQKKARMTEEKIFIRGLGKTMATAVVYGNRTTTPEQVNGFSTRYNLTTLANVQGGGDTGTATTSILVIDWGEDKVFFVYPNSSKTLGIDAEDLGKCTVVDAGGTNEFQAYRTLFKVHWGIVVRDDRYVQRVANIDPVYGQTKDLDPHMLINALNNLPDPEDTSGVVIYCNRDIKKSIDIKAYEKSNGFYVMPDIFGRPVSTFQGIPVRLHEAILSTETAIS